MTAYDSNLPPLNIRLIFHKYDKDADGFIGVEDLVSVLRELDESLTEAEIQEHLQNAGLHGGLNTVVSFENFQKLLKQVMDDSKREKRLRRVFQEFDEEKKGYIEAQGIKRLLKRLNIEYTESDIDLMIKTADTKGDGRVDYYEFVQIFNEPDGI